MVKLEPLNFKPRPFIHRNYTCNNEVSYSARSKSLYPFSGANIAPESSCVTTCAREVLHGIDQYTRRSMPRSQPPQRTPLAMVPQTLSDGDSTSTPKPPTLHPTLTSSTSSGSAASAAQPSGLPSRQRRRAPNSVTQNACLNCKKARSKVSQNRVTRLHCFVIETES